MTTYKRAELARWQKVYTHQYAAQATDCIIGLKQNLIAEDSDRKRSASLGDAQAGWKTGMAA